MTEEKLIQPYYRQRAKEVVDMLFDKRLLNDSLDRDTIVRLERLSWAGYSSRNVNLPLR